ncbi:hypothetical protein FOZ60_000881 [Perkinsus olseni]|uniref:Uncharacterized protein n=1 Tax=Perkinsus olseni TaxID=32597 RepID=A0A7J6PJV5_PEROL|nr:hypothetical protein FOZ60_000881 [Perkinsus olseni]
MSSVRDQYVRRRSPCKSNVSNLTEVEFFISSIDLCCMISSFHPPSQMRVAIAAVILELVSGGSAISSEDTMPTGDYCEGVLPDRWL